MKYYAILIIIMFASCSDPKDGEIKVIEYEGCEYFDNPAYPANHVYTHKGNCKNPIHIYNKK